jgi:ribosomal protein S12 methylthiotransferase
LKIGFVSLGCPKNLVDSEVMMGQLVSRGHELTPHPDQADVLVVNTLQLHRSRQAGVRGYHP